MDTNKQASGIAAVVLAAGTSRRMGTPKQLLRLGDRTLLQHTLANVLASQVGDIVVVLGAGAKEVRQQVATDRVRVVVNPDFEQGMGTSLRAGVAALSPCIQGVFVVLADQPFIKPDTFNRLIDYHARSGAQITLPLYRGFRGNPVLLDRSMFAETMGLSGDVGCRAIFGGHTDGIHKFEVGDAGILLDIDTEQDLRRPATLDWNLPAIESKGEAVAGGPELVIVGRDTVAQALVKFGRLLGFVVTVVDPFLRLHEVPDAERVLHVMDFSVLSVAERAFVIASRGQFDEEAAEQALAADGCYTGLVANRKRAAEILNALRGLGVAEDKLKRVKAPAGLEIGARAPEEIALSIMAEIVAERAQRLRPKS